MAQLTLTFSSSSSSSVPDAPQEPPPPPPRPVYSARPADLDAADEAGSAALQAQVAWAALSCSRSLAVYAPELALAVVYGERRLMAGGLSAAAARALTGPRLMVPCLEGADPWPLVAALTGAAHPGGAGETGSP